MNVRSLVAAALFCLSVSASAATITFTSTDTSFVVTGTVELPPNSANPGANFLLTSTDATINGTPTSIDFYFWQTSIGGFDLIALYSADSTPIFGTDGAMLYSGDETAPTLLYGTYSVTARTGADYDGTLVLSPDATATPEPSSLALLGTGVLGTVATLRRRILRR